MKTNSASRRNVLRGTGVLALAAALGPAFASASQAAADVDLQALLKLEGTIDHRDVFYSARQKNATEKMA